MKFKYRTGGKELSQMKSLEILTLSANLRDY